MNRPIKSERSKIVAQMVRRGSMQENTFDKNFWRKAGHELRFSAAWEMVGELSAFRGVKNECESRLQRSIQHIQFRKS